MKRMLAAGLTVALLLACSPGADAQTSLGAVAEMDLPRLPMGLQGDLMLHRLPGSGTRDGFRQLSAVVSGRLDLLWSPSVLTYLTGGVGLYGSDYDPDDTGMPSHVAPYVNGGLSGGAGLRTNAGPVRPFIAIRYHRVMSTDARAFVPVTIEVYF